MSWFTSLMVALAVSATAAPLQAASIVGLFNTGTDASGTALVGGNGVTDPNYTIVDSSDASLIGKPAVTYNFPYPIAEDGNSRWVSTDASGLAPASTTFRLAFDLTGYDAATAEITGNLAADNAATIKLNGVDTGFTAFGFSAFSSFSLTSGFVGGVNTLDFVVLNAGGPGAFRVDDLVGTADLGVVPEPPGVVPEPGTWALLILGFGLVGGALRGRRAYFAPQ
jgi:hypothetical protein